MSPILGSGQGSDTVLCDLFVIDTYIYDKDTTMNRFNLSYVDDQQVVSEHHIHYYESRQEMKISIPITDLVYNIKRFCDSISKVYVFSNILLQSPIYRLELQSYFRPKKTNLYKAPGLINIRSKKYLEGVSSEMWFGVDFWQYAKCSKQELLQCDWLECEDTSDYFYVKAWPELFHSSDGEQGVIQRKLLNLLFGINESRPHCMVAEEGSTGSFSQSVFVNGENVSRLGGLEENT